MLGVLGLRRTRRHGTRGRGLAVAGVVLGALGTVALLVVGVGAVLLARSSAPVPVDLSAPRTVRAQQVVVGSCLRSLPDDGEVDRVVVVPCDDPHEAEVTGGHTFADDAVWPGQQAADARVARECASAGEDAGRLVVWSPTEAGWARGDRTGLCLVVGGAGG